MSEIKHLLYESGVEETFALVVEDSQYAGTYEIEMPDKFYEIDSVIDINEDYFNIDNIILGDTEKIRFLEYSNPIAYDIVKKVYGEKGGDGKIIFQWKAKNANDEVDLLGSGYELNLNKYSHKFEQSMMVIETEIKKREVQNKFLTREDVSVNLFSEKDLDNNEVEPLVLDDVYFKEGVRKKGNFYFFNIQQSPFLSQYVRTFQFLYTRSDGFEIGDNPNNESGYYHVSSLVLLYQGVQLSTLSQLPDINVEVSNLHVYAIHESTTPNFEFNVVIKNGVNIVRRVKIDDFTPIPDFPSDTKKYAEIKILNKTVSIGNLQPNESVELLFESKDSTVAGFMQVDTNTSFEITANLTQPLRKIKMIRLKDAIQRLSKIYTGENILVQSNILNATGFYYNTAISTGMFMRGLPEVYNTNKITTSFKTLFYESVSKLMALGFDLQDDKVIIEDVSYFFKDSESYDFSGKEFLQENFVIENDLENSFNQLIFGSKKFSTNKKGDLKNYNTKLEALTPLKSVKTKFDKTIDAIIDEDKIAEIIMDKSNATNDNDDDLIIVDLVEVSNYEDDGILSNCIHSEESGYLWLTCFETPFDTFPLEVGGYLEITSGLNTGNWQILEINKAKIRLNKTSGIQTGTSETPISFTVSNITKNRTDEGFTVNGVRDKRSSTNLRHNPKYQMSRWFPYFGSGLNKKLDSEEIIVTNYKNNGEVEISPNSSALSNELQGNTTFKVNETLERLRDHKQPIFNGQKIEITLTEVLFYEYWECFNKWRNERGFITVQTPEGEKKVYPFGKKAFSFNGQLNELSIKGKVKNTYL